MGSENNHNSIETGHHTSYQETALLICPFLKRGKESGALFTEEDQIEEAMGLTEALDLELSHCEVVKLQQLAPGSFFGKGKLEEIAALSEELEPDIIIVNYSLSPVQQRNLEKKWHAKVIDRTGLILEIFGARAQTSEGKIQVELAALEYQRSRLVRSWTHLERQRGGAGFMGGPGETQIEVDRRLIAERITRLKKDLEQVKKSRELQKRSRKKVPFPTVSLVGYTNAGKSTLFNTMTEAEVMAEDLLFATLDPTMRKLELANNSEIILSDTVGFIADLPTDLIAAFRATLEHVQESDVILHVIDVSKDTYTIQRDNVITILKELGIDYEVDQRIVEVYNKIDLLDEEDQQRFINKTKFNDNSVWVSALTGQNSDGLIEAIQSKLSEQRYIFWVQLPYSDGRALAWLYEHGHITDRTDGEDGIRLEFDINPIHSGRFANEYAYPLHRLDSDIEDKTAIDEETGEDEETGIEEKYQTSL